MRQAVVKAYEVNRSSSSSWLKQVPVDWAEYPGRAIFREKEIKNDGLQETTVLSLSFGSIVVKPEKVGGLTPASYETYQIVEPGDVIVRSTDLQNDQTSLRVGLVRDKGIITSAYLCLTHTEKVTDDFGYLLLHAYDLAKFLYGLGSGLRQNLSFADLKGLTFPVPPVEDQQAIVRYVAALDQKANRFTVNKRALIRLLSEQRLAVINKVVSGELSKSKSRKRSRIEGLASIPTDWEERPFVRCSIERADYRGSTPEKVESGVFLVTAKNVRMGFIDYEVSKEYVRDDQYDKIMRRGLPQVGDLLLTMEAPLGNVALVDREDVAFAQRVIRFRFDPERVIPEYGLHACMSSYFQNQLRVRATGSTAAGMKASKLPQLFLAVPPLPEQKALVEQVKRDLAVVDGAIDRARRETQLIREYRNRLVVDVVTGRLDVRHAAATLAEVPLGEAALADVDAAADNEPDDAELFEEPEGAPA